MPNVTPASVRARLHLEIGEEHNASAWLSSLLTLEPSGIVATETVETGTPIVPDAGYVTGQTIDINLAARKTHQRVVGLSPDISGKLTSTQREALRRLLAVVLSKALQTGFPIESTAVDFEEDPEEDTRRAVLRVITDTDAGQSFAFWESLGDEFDVLLKTVPPAIRTALAEMVGVRFHWSVPF